MKPPPSAQSGAADRTLRDEARRAAHGLAAQGVGHLVSFGLAAVLLTVTPRWLGAHGLGQWIAFRSAILLLSVLSGLGSLQTVGRHYVDAWASGDEQAAGRIFKVVMCSRLGWGTMGAVGAFFITRAGAPEMGNAAAPVAAMCVLSIGIGVSLLLLPYAHRDRVRLAWIRVLEAVLVPVLVLVAYRAGGLPGLPWAALTGDVIFLGVSWHAARRYWTWPEGWPTWAETWKLSRYGLFAALATASAFLLIQFIPVLLRLSGWAAAEIGRVGLGLRISQAVLSALTTLSVSLFPTLMVAKVRADEQTMRRWHDLACRWGGLVAIGTAGSMVWCGPWICRNVFGPDFTTVLPILVCCLFAVFPLWVANQLNQYAFLAGRSAVAALGALFLPLGYFVSVWGLGLHPAPALLAGACLFAFAARAVQRGPHQPAVSLFRLAGPLLTALAAFAWAQVPGPAWLRGVFFLAWIAVFAAVAFGTGSVRFAEITAIRRLMRADREEEPAEAAELS